MDIEDLGKAYGALAPVLQKSGQSPLAIAGRVIGLGQAEMQAGIPKWAWVGIGLVAGGAVVWIWGDRAKAWIKR